MGKQDDSDRRGNDRDDDRGKDDKKDTSGHWPPELSMYPPQLLQKCNRQHERQVK